MQKPPWTEKEIEYVAKNYHKKTARDIANYLGRTINAVYKCAQELIRSGRMKQKQKPWSDEDIERARELLADGLTARQVAQRLKRTGPGVEHATKKYLGYILDLRSKDVTFVYSLTEVSRLFGLSTGGSAKPPRWVEKGWLKATVNRSKKFGGLRYSISHEAITEFMHVQEAWPEWSVDDITDRYWREHANDIRQESGRWILLARWAESLHFTKRTALNWKDRGHMQGVRMRKYRNHWYVWSDDVKDFVAPSERPRKQAA